MMAYSSQLKERYLRTLFMHLWLKSVGKTHNGAYMWTLKWIRGGRTNILNMSSSKIRSGFGRRAKTEWYLPRLPPWLLSASLQFLQVCREEGRPTLVQPPAVCLAWSRTRHAGMLSISHMSFQASSILALRPEGHEDDYSSTETHRTNKVSVQFIVFYFQLNTTMQSKNQHNKQVLL